MVGMRYDFDFQVETGERVETGGQVETDYMYLIVLETHTSISVHNVVFW